MGSKSRHKVRSPQKHEKALPALADRALAFALLARLQIGRAESLLGLPLVDVRGQAGFVSGRGIAVQNTLLDRLVNDRDRARQSLQRILGRALLDQLAQLPNLRTEAGPVGTVDLIALLVLAITLLG